MPLVVLGAIGDAHAAPVVISNPYPAPTGVDGKGTGLCMDTAISATPNKDFAVTDDGYNNAVNSFIDESSNRIEAVVRTPLDLSDSEDLPGGPTISYGDFTNSDPSCAVGGCRFFGPNDDSDKLNSFGARLRGFLNVPENLVNKPIHIGVYNDDAVSLTLFDKSGQTYSVFLQAPVLGAATWRESNTVTFQQAGFYPLEILFVEITEHAALELSFLDAGSSFTDFRLPANVAGSLNLKDAGFSLFQPAQFFQTLSGAPSFADLNKCQQCKRQFAGAPGNGGCDGSYYCNAAALCAPCDTDEKCGPSCSLCSGTASHCITENGSASCQQCRDTHDCEDGKVCDPATHTCEQCQEDKDCPRGNICEKHVCVLCDTAAQCAGNSCNCCPTGSNGKPMQCADINKNGYPACVECATDADCPSPQVCDKFTGHCLDKLPANSTPDCCGAACQRCPTDFPFCLPGPVGTACAECRADKDCKDGDFCLSGQCQSCTKDRRCGERCTSCGGDTPFCFADRTADGAVCVRCESDDQCAGGGTCDKTTHTCSKGCAQSCAPATPYCDGEKCVECYADTQCPCGGTCDLTNNTCTTSCKANVDCLGNEHCKWNSDVTAKDCALGPMPGTECSRGLDQVLGVSSDKLETPEICGTAPKGEGGCTASGEGAAGMTEASALGLLSALLLVLRRRRAQS